ARSALLHPFGSSARRFPPGRRHFSLRGPKSPRVAGWSRHSARRPVTTGAFLSAVGLSGSLPTARPCEAMARLSLRPRRSGVASLFWEASGEHLVRSAPDPGRLRRLPPASQELVRESESTPKSGESCRELRGKRPSCIAVNIGDRKRIRKGRGVADPRQIVM